MIRTDRAEFQTAALAILGLAFAPLGLVAQDAECEFEGSGAATRASEAMSRITDASTPEEQVAARTEALEALEVELDGENAIVFLFAAQAHIGLDNFDQARDMLARFDEVAAPECAEHGKQQRYVGWVKLYNAGVQEYSAGENVAALETFRMANRFHPDLRSYNNAGLLQSETGDIAGAIETYQEALAADIAEADPEQLRGVLRSLGDLLIEQGRSEEAMAAFGAYLADNPDDVAIRIRHAGLLGEAGQTAESEAIFAEIMQRTDLESQQWVEVGVGFYYAQNYADAATAFGSARAGNPFNKEAMENYVNASVLAGRPGPVLALADTLVTWYPYDSETYALLTRALADADMNDRAMEMMEAGEATDVIFHSVQMAARSDGSYVVQGSIEARSEDLDVAIPFEFLDANGQVVLTEVLSTTAPAGTRGTFRLDVSADVPLAGFRYKKTGT